MRHLLLITSNAFVQSIQKQLSNLDLWSDGKESVKTREQVRNGANICERWSTAVEQLTDFYWRNYPAHPWKGEPFRATYLSQFKTRLQEIVSVRSSYDQALRISPDLGQQDFATRKVFMPFANINAIQYSPFNDSQWKSAMSQYENSLTTVDRQLSDRLKIHFDELRENPQKMLVEYKRCSDLLKRESLKKTLNSYREFLLGQMKTEMKICIDEFDQLRNGDKKSNQKGAEQMTIAGALESSRQIEAKVKIQ